MSTFAAATVLVAVLAVPVLLAAFYLALLALFSFSRVRTPPAGSAPPLRFRLVVPAHDEELGIGRTVSSLLALDYPPELRRLWVVADNCTDRTADVAREAGAEVLVRTDPDQRGKGYALDFAFTRCQSEGWADAVVVVDADTVTKGNLLGAMASALASGAEAAQAHYGILADRNSWRTRLLRLSFALFHGVRSRARERLGLSCGLRGNGMAFRVGLFSRVPHKAFSVVEDLEYGLDLGAAGVRVAYVEQTEVLGEMPSNEVGARSQRRRWEGGRAALRRRVPTLLAEAWRKRDWLLADLAIDLALPSLSTLCALAALGTALAGALAYSGIVSAIAVAPWVAADSCFFGYVLSGWAASGVGARGLLDLAWAPVFLIWKLFRVGVGSRARPTSWVRTARDRR